MERKIGEIFKFEGEWYQCIVGKDCKNCAFNKRKCYIVIDNDDPIGDCCADRRKDNKDVIFKKLEKVGKPFLYKGKQMQSYIRATDELICNWNNNLLLLEHGNSDIIDIEIKQNKEDMEQEIEYFGDENAKCFNSESIEKNLKPFNLDAAKQGKPVCTRDGCKVRIICFDRKDNTPIVALIERVDGIEILQCFYNDGKCFHDSTSDNDLMMLPQKKEGWVNVYALNTCYSSKEEAEANIDQDYEHEYVRTVKIEWEE